MGDFQKQIKSFKDLLDSGEMVNLTIKTEDGGSFKVHFEIMALQSPYFKCLIETNQKPPSEAFVAGPSEETMATIIDYIYTSELHLKQDKVKDLVEAAELLGIPEIVQLCKSFLMSKLSNENCISVYNFSKHYHYDDLQEKATHFILYNFEKIYPLNPQFAFLTLEDLVSILSADVLNVSKEESVYWAVMKWIESDVTNRSVHVPSLLRCVRIGLCDPNFFEETIWPNTVIEGNEECQHLLIQASQLFLDIQAKSMGEGQDNNNNNNHRLETFDVHHPFLRPRVPNELIFVMGGWSAGSATNMMETYDLKTKRWFLTCYPDSIPRAYHGMVWHQNLIYVIGGFDGNQCFNSVRCYDPVSHAWRERGCMHVQRCYVSVATLGDCIYAMGGYDGHRRSKSCEKYNPETNQWTLVANMHSIRSDASSDALDGKIYIVGGFNGSQVLESAECYNPDANEWILITNMNSPRSGVKLVAFRNYLYAIGGFNGNNRLSSVERYDKVTKTWIYVSPMNGPRSNFATSVLNGFLYAIGGFNGLSTITSVEMYDAHSNSWEHVTDLNMNRSALAACKINDISNAHEYTYIGAHC